LPKLNVEVVNAVVKAGLANHCQIAPFSRFARKNYFYPDLPKNYQISQYELPLAHEGYLMIPSNGEEKKIGITRIHMEEDAGKLIHGENLGDPDSSYVDFNRCGVPLMEIVSEPDLRNSQEAKEYLVKLRTVLRYIGVSDCNMEEGSLRCDANVSMRPVGQKEFGVRTEVKNMNSFKNVQRALDYEIKRQIGLLEEGETVHQETRLFDVAKGETQPMRSKEEAHDYRYFPDPDLMPLEVDQNWTARIGDSLPELPDPRRERFVSQYQIPEYDAGVLTAERSVADYYESCMELFPDAKSVSNWVMGDVLRTLKEKNIEITDCPVTPKMLVDMLKMVKDGAISGKLAKTVYEEMETSGKDPETIVQEKGLVQISDEGELQKIADEIIANNLDQVAQYQGGKTKLFGFFVGQVMKASGGKANPPLVNKILKEKLGGS